MAPGKLLTSFVYAHAVFEVACAYNFIFSPGALHNGMTPSAGFATYGFECVGLCCFFWALLLMMKAHDATVLALDALFNFVWSAYLGSIYLGLPWRPEMHMVDGSWAMAPTAAHICFATSAFFASKAAMPKRKGKEAARKA